LHLVILATFFNNLPNPGKLLDFLALAISYGIVVEFAPFRWANNFNRFYMVIIRLSRGGSKNRPFFNVVVADSRNRRDGRFIERVGFYNPVATEGQEAVRLQMERVTFWQSKGAQLSEAVSKLVKNAGAAVA
jgi:small subunit ribosomal protein S16